MYRNVKYSERGVVGAFPATVSFCRQSVRAVCPAVLRERCPGRIAETMRGMYGNAENPYKRTPLLWPTGRRFLFLMTMNMRARNCTGNSRRCGRLSSASVLLVSVFLFFGGAVFGQRVGVRTNLLYWATTTPNVGLEFRLSPRYTLSAAVGYNPFDYPNRLSSRGVAVNPKLHHWLVMPEARYWFCRAFERHHIGLHALYGQYNIGGMKFPAFLEDFRYWGWAAGGGLSFGYQWALAGSWGLELSAGAGYVFFRYDKYDIGACGDLIGRYRRNYVGPTKASVSFVYYIR